MLFLLATFLLFLDLLPPKFISDLETSFYLVCYEDKTGLLVRCAFYSDTFVVNGTFGSVCSLIGLLPIHVLILMSFLDIETGLSVNLAAFLSTLEIVKGLSLNVATL